MGSYMVAVGNSMGKCFCHGHIKEGSGAVRTGSSDHRRDYNRLDSGGYDPSGNLVNPEG